MKYVLTIVLLFSMLSVAGCNSIAQAKEQAKPAESEYKQESGPVFRTDRKEIDLGTITSDDTEIVGPVIFRNTGDEVLLITKVHGPCSCFAGHSGDKSVQPGNEGILEVRFDKDKIPAGRVRRLAKIETNDPDNKIVKVYFNFNVERSADEEEKRILRNELSMIRKELRFLRKDTRKILAELASLKASQKKAKTAKKRKPDTTVYNVSLGTSPILGSKDTPVTIVIFSDLQCPYCVREYPKLKQMLKEYPDKVKVILKHYPLPFHKQAKPAHAAMELARIEQGPQAFWKMHDMIIANPKKLELTDLRGYAETLKIDLLKFDAVMADDKQIDKLLQTDLDEARKCKVRGTPTILINGLKLTDRSIKGYKKRIDEIPGK